MIRNLVHLVGVLGALPLLSLVASPQVSGNVLEAGTLTPLPDATVSVQAANLRAVTAADGTFDLAAASGTNLVIVGAKKGYFNASVTVSAPTGGVQILLEPVPQDDHAGYAFVPPGNCGGCHADQFTQWMDSPMARAGANTWVYDIYDGSGTPGGMGGFVYTNDSKFATSNPASECASCHQPEPWVENPGSALEDINNLSAGAMHGISCEVCHKIADIDETKKSFPGIWPGVVTLTRPAPGATQVMYGVMGDTSFISPNDMRPSYQPQLVSAVCGACHQDKNDPDEDGDFEEDNGVISEPTYVEWLESPYADPDSGLAASCADCHMPAYGASLVSYFGGVHGRDPDTIRHHRIEGTTAVYLENAVDLVVDCRWADDELQVVVDVKNTGTGHHVPTGVTIRNMILLVEVTRQSDGQALTQILGPTVHDLGGVGDPAQGYYAGLPGQLFAKINHDENGVGPTFFTDATGITLDNRIPALATDRSGYVFDAPPGTGQVSVRTRLIYRRAFRGFVDAKQWTTDGHGNPLEDIAAPHFGHLMEQVDLTCSPGITIYGCGTNPAGSLSVLRGQPLLGRKVVFGLDNPLGTQTPGAATFLYFADASQPDYPCGVLVPRLGMGGPGAPGELLIDLGNPNPLHRISGGPWPGPGTPARISVAIPPDPALAGETFYVQGLIVDPGGAVPLGLTNAAKVRIGTERTH